MTFVYDVFTFCNGFNQSKTGNKSSGQTKSVKKVIKTTLGKYNINDDWALFTAKNICPSSKCYNHIQFIAQTQSNQ